MAPVPEASSAGSIASSSAIVPGISNAALFILLAILVIVFLGIWSWVLMSYVPSCLSRRADHEQQRVHAETALWTALLSALPIAAFPYADEGNGTHTTLHVNPSSKEERQHVLALSPSTPPIAGVPSATAAVSSPPEESGNSADNGIILAANEPQLCISTEAHAQDKSSSLPALSSTVPPPPHNLHPSLPASTPIAPSPTSPLSVVISSQDMSHPLAPADAAGSTAISFSRPSYPCDNLPNERDDHPRNIHHYGGLRPASSNTNATMNSQTDSAPTVLEGTSGDVDLGDMTVPSSPSLHHTTSVNETLSSSTDDLSAKCSKTSACHDDADCGVIVPSASSLSESISWDPELSRSIQCLGLWIEQQQTAKQSRETNLEDEKTIGLGFRSAYTYEGEKEATDKEHGQLLERYSKPLLEGSYDSLPTIKPYVAYNDTLYSLSTDSIDEDEEAIPRDNAISTLINHLYAGEPAWSSAAKTFGPVIVIDECDSAADWSVSDDSTCFSPMTPEGLEYLSPSWC